MRLNGRSASYGVLLALFSLAGCGGSSVSTGLPRDEQLNKLSASDAATACHNFANSLTYGDDVVTGICAAQLLAQGKAACDSALTNCVTQTKSQVMSSQMTLNANCDKSDTTAQLASCTATVGELEDCLSSQKDYINERYGSVTCSTTSPPTGTFDPFSTSACSALRTKCPNSFDG